MSSVHVARQGFITKSALPSVSRERGTTTVADNRTVLLLNGNGTNGAQNNTFLDSSTNNFSITRNGNATQGSFSPFTLPDGQWSNFFDGTGDFLTTPSNSALDCSGDFTFECWFYLTATVADYRMFISNATTNNTYISLKSGGTGGVLQLVAAATEQANFSLNNSVTPNTWAHVAVVRSGTTLTGYINGVSLGSVTSSANFAFSNGQGTSIGKWGGGTQLWTGYLSNVRIVKGTAVYTSNFTPPTTPLTAITNTSLLTCQSNRFRDNSSNNFAITRNGDVRVTAFSPFAPTSAYDPATNGGSGYFDGTGDYLSATQNGVLDVGTGDFTIEGWMYVASNASSYNFLFNYSYSGGGLYIRFPDSGFGNKLQVSMNNDVTKWSCPITRSDVVNRWVHVALTRQSNACRLWVDGVLQNINSGINPSTYPFTSFTSNESIGNPTSCRVGEGFIGNIASLRVVKGTAVYTSAFTPPTAPVTNITNTSLLLNFTNAGIVDSAGKNVIETVGNAQISTSVKKYGSGSLSFDGTGDYLLQTANIDNYTLGTGDFTIEFWLYLNSTGGTQFVLGFRPQFTNGNYPIFYFSSGTLRFNVGLTDRLSASVAATTWYHVAVSRSGTSTRMFLDGVQVGSTYTDSTNYIASRFVLGIDDYTLGGSALNGYIDDLRITKGQARYTATFTPPTSELAIVGTTTNIVNNSTYGVYQLA